MQTKSIPDMLFDLTDALQNPAFTSAGECKAFHDPGFSTIRTPRNSLPESQGHYPATSWKTAIIVNTTKTARGSRWEELGAILINLFNCLSDQRKNISFVGLSQASDIDNEICGLREAIEHVWTNEPSDSLLGARKFEAALLSASGRLYGITTPHTSLIFMVPDGVLPNDISKIQRAILQKCKLVRGINLRKSGLIISFVLMEPNRYMLEPLIKLSLSVNEDRAVIGTVVR
jgi:hypothetical protein